MCQLRALHAVIKRQFFNIYQNIKVTFYMSNTKCYWNCFWDMIDLIIVNGSRVNGSHDPRDPSIFVDQFDPWPMTHWLIVSCRSGTDTIALINSTHAHSTLSKRVIGPTLTGIVPSGAARLNQPMNVNVSAQFLTVRTQHRLVPDWRLRHFIVLAVFFRCSILHQHWLILKLIVSYRQWSR